MIGQVRGKKTGDVVSTLSSNHVSQWVDNRDSIHDWGGPPRPGDVDKREVRDDPVVKAETRCFWVHRFKDRKGIK